MGKYNLPAFGEAINQRLRKAKLTTYQFGKIVGMESSQVSDLIDGKVLPSDQLANQIKLQLGLDLQAFSWEPINPSTTFKQAKVFNLSDYRKH